MTLLHQAAQKAVEALHSAAAGLDWYRDMCPQFESPADAEMTEQMEAAVEALESALQQQPEPVAYMDEKGEFHRLPRFHFLGLVDESCGSRDHIWSGTSLAEAGEAWKRFVAQGSKDVDLTGWGCGIIADHRLMSRQFTAAAGAFACPICGQDTPHQHSPEAVDFHRDNEKWAQEQHAKAWQKAEARVGALEARYPPRTPLYASPALQHQEEPREPELLALIERYAAEREEIAVEAHSFPGDSWKNKQPAADETLAKIKRALAASPSTTQQQEAIDRFNEQQIALHQQITATQQPSVAAHALNTTPVVDHATQQQEAGSGWRPIESAPKDGSEMLLFNGQIVAQGWWEHQEPYIREHRDMDGRYIDQDEHDGYGGWLDFAGGMLPEPTHWQPMPAAPSTPEKAGGVTTTVPPAGSGAKVYCCYGAYCDAGHDADCKGTPGVPASDPPGCEGCNCAACELRRKHESADGVKGANDAQA